MVQKGARLRKRLVPMDSVYCGRQGIQFSNGSWNGAPTTYVRTPSSTDRRYKSVWACWDETHKGPPYEEGGPFLNCRADYPWTQLSPGFRLSAPYVSSMRVVFEGNFVPLSFGPNAPTNASMVGIGTAGQYADSVIDAEPFGPTGFKRAKPQIESADLAQMIGEASEIPRMLQTTARGLRDVYRGLGGKPGLAISPRNVADHFLNHEFGWRPFLRDLKKLLYASQEGRRRLAQVKRDSGKLVRRRVTIRQGDPERNHVLRTYGPDVYPSLFGQLLKDTQFDGRVCKGYTDYFETVEDRIWFEGAFKYHFPDLAKFHPQMRGVQKVLDLMTIYGLRISPSVLWEVTPWSWLVDWFSTVGDSLDNFSSFAMDAMVAPYAFVMRHRIIKYTTEACIFTRENGNLYMSWEAFADTKHRAVASPYGFGLTWPDFTPRQLAILAALGISRQRTRTL